MYMLLRRSHCVPGRLPEVLEKGIPIVETINDRYGLDFGVSVQLGGNPDVFGLAGGFETLGAYQDYRAAVSADAEIAAKVAEVTAMTTWTEDVIGQALMPPGDKALFSLVNQARMHMPRVADAIPFALEVAEFAEAKTGVKVGVMTAMTGDRSIVGFVARYDGLDALAASTAELEADPEYLEFFKRSADLFVDGSLEQTIWQRMH